MNEIKSLVSYFIEFQNNGTILPKEYLQDYAVDEPNQWSIIIVTQDKKAFLANNSY